MSISTGCICDAFLLIFLVMLERHNSDTIMTNHLNKAQQIQALTGLTSQHFADLVRIAQLIFDPAGGIAGHRIEIDWESIGIPQTVVEDLREFGTKYPYASPYMAIETVWEQLAPATRNWLFENKAQLWRIEELFPALDED